MKKKNKYILKILDTLDITQSYIDWYNNKDVLRYSDNQYRRFSMDSQKKYVINCLNDKNLDLYGIFENSKHVGNMFICGLSSFHKCAEITYVIGSPDNWNKGIATFAISEIIKISKSIYKLNKLCAGVAENNKASIKVLEKNGFVLEGTRLQHLFYNGKFHNQLDYGLIL